MVGVEPSRGAFDLRSGPQDRSVEIEGEPTQAKLLDLLVHQVADQRAQGFQRGVRERLQPRHDRPIGREAMEAAETKEDGIGAEEGKVSHASAAHNDQTHHAQQNLNEPVVASAIVALHGLLDLGAKVEAAKKQPNQF